MSSQPSSDEDGEGAGPVGDSGLDARLDRAVAGGEAVAFLIAVAGDQPGRVYPLTRNTVFIGRAEDADIYISDSSVSGRHARIISGGHGVEIEDLGSTNGTFVGGQRVAKARLRDGDRVMVGSVEFNFLMDRPVEATVALLPAGRWLPTSTPGALMRLPDPRYAPPLPVHPQQQESSDEEGASLAEMVRRMVVAYQFLARYKKVIGVMVAAGVAVGLVSLFVLPPAAAAICEVKLQPQIKSNPVDTEKQSDDASTQLFFGGPERAFINPELVRLTLRRLDGVEPDEARITSVSSRLKFENVVDEAHLYRASYTEGLVDGRPTPPVQFLSVHLQNYVQSEITKALKVFTAEAEFLRNQLKTVEKDLSEISAERTRYRQANSDRLPEEALQTHTSRFTLESRRADLLAQIRRLQGNLDAEKRQLTTDSPVAQNKYQSSQVYRQSLATVNQKLSAAYARGLADGHPEVQQLNDEKRRIEELIEKEMHAETTPTDRESIAGLSALQNRVDMLQGQLSAARSDLADTEKSLVQVRSVVGDLPRVEERVQELSHTQEATNRLHTQLFEKLKKAELQLNLERVSAESRYEVVTAPRLKKAGKVKMGFLRGALGLLAGLFLSAIVIGVREGREMVSQTLATMETRAGPTRWR